MPKDYISILQNDPHFKKAVGPSQPSGYKGASEEETKRAIKAYLDSQNSMTTSARDVENAYKKLIKSTVELQKNVDKSSKLFAKSISDKVVSPLSKIPLVGNNLQKWMSTTLTNSLSKSFKGVMDVFQKNAQIQSASQMKINQGMKQMSDGLKSMKIAYGYAAIEISNKTKMFSRAISDSKVAKNIQEFGKSIGGAGKQAVKSYLDDMKAASKKLTDSKIYKDIQIRTTMAAGYIADGAKNIRDKIVARGEDLSRAFYDIKKKIMQSPLGKPLEAAGRGARQMSSGAANLFSGGMGKLSSMLSRWGPAIGKAIPAVLAGGTALVAVGLIAAALIPVLATATLIAGAFALAFANAIEIWENTIKIRKELGLTYDQATELQEVFTRNEIRMESFGIGMEQVAEIAKDLVTTFGNLDVVLGRYGDKNIEIATKLTEAYGVAASDSAKMISGLQQMYGMTGEQSDRFFEKLQGETKAAGVSFGSIVSDIAQNMDLWVKVGPKNVANLTKAAIQAKAMGNSLSTLNNMSESFEDLETTLQKSSMIQFVTGANFNPFEVYSMAQTGDLEGLQKKAMDTLRTMKKPFDQLTVSVKKDLAGAFGMTLEEMQKMSEYSKMAPKDYEKMQKDTKDWGNALSTVNTVFEKIKHVGQAVLKTMLMPLTKSLENGMKSLDTKMEGVRKKLIEGPNAIAPRLAKLVEKIVQAVTKIISPLDGASKKSKGLFDTIIDGAMNAIEWITKSLEDWFNVIDDEGKTKFDKLIDSVKDFYNEAIAPVVKAFGALFEPNNSGKGFWSNIQDKLNSLLGETLKSLEGPFTDILIIGVNKAVQQIPGLSLLAKSDDEIGKIIADRKNDRTFVGPPTADQMEKKKKGSNFWGDVGTGAEWGTMLAPGLGTELGAIGGGVYNWLKKADGGFIGGSGGPRSDTVPAMLSSGEFVVNSGATSQYRPVLESFNRNRFANGTPGGGQNVFDDISDTLKQLYNYTYKVGGKDSKSSWAITYLKNISDYFDDSLRQYKTTVIGSQGLSTGGRINGPGTETSDSIPARLSRSEYVVKASSARSIGTHNLDYINATGRLPRYSEGGDVPREVIEHSAREMMNTELAEQLGGSHMSGPLGMAQILYESVKDYLSGGEMITNSPMGQMIKESAGLEGGTMNSSRSDFNNMVSGLKRRKAGTLPKGMKIPKFGSSSSKFSMGGLVQALAKGGQVLSPSEIAGYAKMVGNSNIDVATAIALAESGGNPSINNAGLNKDGSIDYGLWQINSVHKGDVVPGAMWSNIYDPMTNARYMNKISKSGTKWTDWSTYNSNAYKKYLGQAGDPAYTGGSKGFIPGYAGGGLFSFLGAFMGGAGGAGKMAAGPPPQSALEWAKSQVGKPYGWGQAGPDSYDCSGLISAVTNIIHGLNPYSHTFNTASFAGGQGVDGFMPGTNGRFTIGVKQGKPGHMAGTIDGVNIESRGSKGVLAGPSARGSMDPLFTDHFYLARSKGGVIKAAKGLDAIVTAPTYANIGGQDILMGEGGKETLQIKPQNDTGDLQSMYLRQIVQLLASMKLQIFLDGKDITNSVKQNMISDALVTS